mgnify:FL=1
MSPPTFAEELADECAPRRRGDEPNAQVEDEAEMQCSPQTRG